MKPVVIPLSMSHVYLLPCEGGYLQIDTGYQHDYPIYLKGLTKAGIALESMRYLLLTHHHDDHAGFLNEFTVDTNVIILVHENAKELLRHGKNDMSQGGGYVNNLIKFAAGIKMRFDPRWTLAFPPFLIRKQDIVINGDDSSILRQIGIPGKIFTTPGHSIDHITLILDDGTVFCGDAASSFLLWAGIHYCTVFMTDMDRAYQSWQKILDAGGRIIFPAHGKPFPAQKLNQNMGRIKTDRLARFF